MLSENSGCKVLLGEGWGLQTDGSQSTHRVLFQRGAEAVLGQVLSALDAVSMEQVHPEWTRPCACTRSYKSHSSRAQISDLRKALGANPTTLALSQGPHDCGMTLSAISLPPGPVALSLWVRLARAQNVLD